MVVLTKLCMQEKNLAVMGIILSKIGVIISIFWDVGTHGVLFVGYYVLVVGDCY